MKKTAFILLVSGMLFAMNNTAYCAEDFDSANYSSVNDETAAQEPQPPAEEEKPVKNTNKKFFSILERNKDNAAESGDSVEFKAKDQKAQEDMQEGEVTNVLVDSDTIEYFPERHEFEAIGHAKVTFPAENSVLTADKIIFNHDTNYIKAYDNVVLLKEGQKVLGDYMHVNLNDENALITDPIMTHLNIKIRAKVANVNNAKTEAMEGTAHLTDKSFFKFSSVPVFNMFDKPFEESMEDRKLFIKEKYNNEWKLKSDLIIVDSYKDRDIVTLKKSDIFLKDLKVGSTGVFKIYTDKEQNYIETNMAELGSFRNLGMYFAPSYVFQLPFASTLKVGPMVNYDTEFGVGGMGRFVNANNRTDIGYSTARGKIVLRGKHFFTKKLYAQYGVNSYLDEMWMGGRMPTYGIQLVHETPYYNEDLKLDFRSRISGGLARDWDSSFSTTRFRWQTTMNKDIYQYKNSDKKFTASFGVGTQSSATAYGTGDTHGVFRIGPYVRTGYKSWNQYIGFFSGGEAGQSPFMFDRLYYGKSSLQIGESLKINKYLTLMYSGMIALSDTPNNTMLQENRFYVAVGPEDFRVLIGYDAYRQTTTFGFDMMLGSENSEMQFKRLILNEPDKLGKSDGKKKKKDTVNVNNQTESDQNNYDPNRPDYSILNNFIQPGIRPPGY